MLARDECGIPAILAQCNFTCTGCTAAPVVQPAPTGNATCGASEYQRSPLTVTTDRICVPCRDGCPAGFTLESVCNQTHDTGCREDTPPASTANADGGSDSVTDLHTVLIAVLAVLLVLVVVFVRCCDLAWVA